MLEWRFVRDLIATVEEDRILFLSFDDFGAIPEIGILSGDGYVSVGTRSPDDIADLILQRLAVHGRPSAPDVAERQFARTLPSELVAQPPNSMTEERPPLQYPQSLSLPTNRSAPRWASYCEINLNGRSLRSVECRISTESPYFRFGFKLLGAKGRIFGDASIESMQGREFLVHVGRNNWNRTQPEISADDVFLAYFVNGVRGEVDRRLLPSARSWTGLLRLLVDTACCCHFWVEDRCVLSKVITAQITKRLVLYAWGDQDGCLVEVGDLRVGAN
ncbi:MAG: hypothetical protein HUU22_02280 [Phycisphaerae bacterium]|nr:hypothetical protein [Phycisphaerae bacterium]NUQ44841.1 hypothetical protein [Phycisphaerae bacterium]